MSIRVGFSSDPEEIPGLAHFLEHMLFLGTQKYPKEAEYSDWLAARGGNSNAYTDFEETNYFFSVAQDALEGTLDRFSQFFIAPLFTPNATDREMHAVGSEHAKNLQSDNWRMNQLDRNQSNPLHPFHKFGTGNVTTLSTTPASLGLNVRDQLLQFHETYYSANIMKLVILGRESLDELSSWVEMYFSQVRNHNASIPTFNGTHPLLPEHLQEQLFVVPIKDDFKLNLVFPLGKSMWPYYRSKPVDVVSYVLGHEGKGSLAAYLKQEGWITTLDAGIYSQGTDYSFMGVVMVLTEQGTGKVDEIMSSFLQFVELMKNSSLEEYYVELKKTRDLNFKFHEKVEPFDVVSDLSTALQIFPPKDVMTGSRLVWEWNETLIAEVLFKLKVENMRMVLVSKNFSANANLNEPIYGTEFFKLKINETQIETWHRVNDASSLALPQLNPYLPTDFNLKVENMRMVLVSKNFSANANLNEPIYGTEFFKLKINETQIETWHRVNDASSLALPQLNPYLPTDFNLKTSTFNLTTPVQLVNVPSGKVWHQLDTSFERPTANWLVRIYTPHRNTPENLMMMTLFVDLFTNSILQDFYPAQLAGLVYDLKSFSSGLTFSLQGYQEKQTTFLQTYFQRLKNFPNTNWTENYFDNSKEEVLRELRNFFKGQPYSQVLSNTYALLIENTWRTQDYLDVIDDVTLEKTLEFFGKFLDSLYIEVLVHGNLLREDALQGWDVINSELSAKPMNHALIKRDRTVILPKGYNFVFKDVLSNIQDENSCTMKYFQVEQCDLVCQVKSELISEMIYQPVFSQLRTQEQLGYIVTAGPMTLKNVEGVRLLVQSNTYDALYLDQRIDLFLETTWKEFLGNLTQADFDEYVSALKLKKEEKPKNLIDLTTEYWFIIQNRLTWNYIEKEVEALMTVKLKDVVDFSHSIFGPSSKKLSVQMYAQKFSENSTKFQPGEIQLENFTHLQDYLPMYPPFRTIFPKLPCDCNHEISTNFPSSNSQTDSQALSNSEDKQSTVAVETVYDGELHEISSVDCGVVY
eukprot:TRINITY_DN2640_c0_g1_i4.p1 TRINITY_DN2640_c0_g1~~TRINITY_DN2640_c0_g1_i4.p1  ORF type:complete len:1093 (+),score=372.86 TRINITY_DN2640_c0_g1_i4:186-3281(+)